MAYRRTDMCNNKPPTTVFHSRLCTMKNSPKRRVNFHMSIGPPQWTACSAWTGLLCGSLTKANHSRKTGGVGWSRNYYYSAVVVCLFGSIWVLVQIFQLKLDMQVQASVLCVPARKSYYFLVHYYRH